MTHTHTLYIIEDCCLCVYVRLSVCVLNHADQHGQTLHKDVNKSKTSERDLLKFTKFYKNLKVPPSKC